MDQDQAAAISLVHQNSVPSVQMQCRITAILRAIATHKRLLLDPMRLASRVPKLERGPTLHLREKDIGGLVQARSSEPISAFRDVALPICFPGLISSRRQPEIGSYIAGPPEPAGLIDRGMECQSRHWPDARDRQEASQGWIIADETADFLVKHRHLWQRQPPERRVVSRRECRQDWMVLGPSSVHRWAKAPLLPLPTTRPKVFRMRLDLPVDLDPDVDEPTANAEQRHSFMGSEALDLNLP